MEGREKVGCAKAAPKSVLVLGQRSQKYEMDIWKTRF